MRWRRLAGMKQIIVMMAAVLVGQSVVGDEKLIADPLVEKAVRSRINKFKGELTKADLGQVVSVNFGNSKITDAGVKELAKMQQLTFLILVNTKITDAGLKELAKLQRLKTLSLVGTKVTKSGVTELKKALPNCRIYGPQSSP